MSELRLSDANKAWIQSTYKLTKPELDHFVDICQRVGLDPMTKQMYAVKHGNRVVHITGIDGYRTIADRTSEYAGGPAPVFVEEDGRLVAATVSVYRMVQGQRCEYAATAYMAEYSAGGGMWKKMPHVMLAKVAEAQALRRAFPASYAGIYTQEEMDQAKSADPEPSGEIPPQREVPKPAKAKGDNAVDLTAAKKILVEQVARWSGKPGKQAVPDLLSLLGMPIDGSISHEQVKDAIEFVQANSDNDFAEVLGKLATDD